MGYWGSKLYENDFTCDVRDTYIGFLERQYCNEDAYKNTLYDFHYSLGTDEEPLLWYALADTQWRFGKLNSEVQERALFWLDNGGGSNLWLNDVCKKQAWSVTMSKLRTQISSPQKKEKVFECPANFQFNPGNVGDVFAYRFHTQSSKTTGCYGKYILFQKVNVRDMGKGYLCPYCVFFDKIFDSIPLKVQLEQMRILPFDLPGRFLPTGRNSEFPLLNMGAVLELSKKRNNPQKYVSFVGSYPVIDFGPSQITRRSEFGWDCIEQTILIYHAEWNQYTYQLYPDYSTVFLERK